MPTGREIDKETLTDDYIINNVWSDEQRTHILSKYSGSELVRIVNNWREKVYNESRTPLVLLELKKIEDSPELEDALLREALTKEDHIKNALQYMQEPTGKEKGYLVWLYSKYTDEKQNALCKRADIAPRHYRDLRDRYEEDWQEYLYESDYFFKDVSVKAGFIIDENLKSLENFIKHLRILGFNGVDEWAENKPLDDTIDKALSAALEYSGHYHCELDKWYNLKFLEWWIQLTPEEQEGYRRT